MRDRRICRAFGWAVGGLRLPASTRRNGPEDTHPNRSNQKHSHVNRKLAHKASRKLAIGHVRRDLIGCRFMTTGWPDYRGRAVCSTDSERAYKYGSDGGSAKKQAQKNRRGGRFFLYSSCIEQQLEVCRGAPRGTRESCDSKRQVTANPGNARPRWPKPIFTNDSRRQFRVSTC